MVLFHPLRLLLTKDVDGIRCRLSAIRARILVLFHGLGRYTSDVEKTTSAHIMNVPLYTKPLKFDH